MANRCTMPIGLIVALLGLACWTGLRSSGPNTSAVSSRERRLMLNLRAGPAPGSLNKMCTAMNCAMTSGVCVLHGKCREALQCSMKCANVPVNKIAGCQYLCEMTFGYASPEYNDFIKCAVDNNCITPTPQDGECRATDSDAVQSITDMSQIAGDWWVTRGINCGRTDMGDKENGGGYDWYPCQHERFIQVKGTDGKMFWQNNITYCGGSNGGLKQCTTSVIDTVANVSLTAPGTVHHLYTDAPLAPQTEYWRIVSHPHPDWVFVIWCGNTPLLPYNGGIVLSRAARDDSNIPPAVVADFKKTANKFGVEWDELCQSSNAECP